MAKKGKKSDSAAASQTAAEAAAPAAAPTPAAGFDSELDAFFKAAPPAAPAIIPAAATTPKPAASSPSASRSAPGPSNSKKRKAAQPEPQEVLEQDDDDEDSEQEDHEEEAEDDDDVEMEEGDGDLSSIDESLDDEGSLLFSNSEDDASDKDGDDDVDAEDQEPYVPPQHESVSKSQTTQDAKPRKKTTFKEESEPSELRDQRTLFIGNLPIETAQSRPLQRKVVSFIESLSPYPILTKAVGLRFRSVAFATPTVHLDADDDEDDDAAKKKKAGKAKERSQNYREALAAVEGGDKAQAPLTAQQKRKIAFINKDFHEKAKTVSAYVTIAHPKAVLQHLHDITPAKAKAKDAQSEPIQLDDRLTGTVLAALIASFADGQSFEGRHLRVDLVKSISPSEVLTSGLEKVKTFDGQLVGSSSSTTDPKSTLFVGGLDFEVDEEEVRAFFEAMLVDELGEAGEAVTLPVAGLDGEPAPKELLDALAREFPIVPPEKRKVTDSVVRSAEWVRSVRLIRDAATQMGKGFGYVRFTSQQCVDEVMAAFNAEQAFLESVKGPKGSLGASAAIAQGGKEFKRRFKLHGRPIRVALCKSQTKSTTPARRNANAGGDAEPTTPQRKSPRYERSSGAPTPNGTSPHALAAKRQRPATKIVPGSPSAARMADKADIAKKAELYATLSKDQRKQMKKDDADRVNRRMAKKNKKLADGAHPARRDRSLVAEGEKAKTKDKVKLRQPTAASRPANKAGGRDAKRFKPSGPKASGSGPKRGPAKSS